MHRTTTTSKKFCWFHSLLKLYSAGASAAAAQWKRENRRPRKAKWKIRAEKVNFIASSWRETVIPRRLNASSLRKLHWWLVASTAAYSPFIRWTHIGVTRLNLSLFLLAFHLYGNKYVTYLFRCCTKWALHVRCEHTGVVTCSNISSMFIVGCKIGMEGFRIWSVLCYINIIYICLYILCTQLNAKNRFLCYMYISIVAYPRSHSIDLHRIWYL